MTIIPDGFEDQAAERRVQAQVDSLVDVLNKAFHDHLTPLLTQATDGGVPRDILLMAVCCHVGHVLGTAACSSTSHSDEGRLARFLLGNVIKLIQHTDWERYRANFDALCAEEAAGMATHAGRRPS
jgi:hypothetical protein